jgi:hypothetical protein
MNIWQDCSEWVPSAAGLLPAQKKITQKTAEFLQTPSGIRKRDASVQLFFISMGFYPIPYIFIFYT